MRLRILSAIIILLTVASQVQASAPMLQTYQGRLRQTGLPVTGNRSVGVFLCPELAGPIANCFNTGVQGVQVTNGLFRTTFTAPSGVDWTTGEWFLEIQVDGNAFTPREKLTSAPFTIYASSASALKANPGETAVAVHNHVRLDRFGGTAPTATDAGCGAGWLLQGNDGVGRIQLGTTGLDTFCKLNFGAAWSPNPPVCHFNNESRFQPLTINAVDTLSATFATSGVTLTGGDVISYLCLSY